MKRILLVISFFVSLVASAQNPPTQTIGSPGNIVTARGFLGFDTAVVFRTSRDTITANLNPYLKYQRGAQFREADTIWQRSQDLTKWFRAGGAGSVYTDSSASFIPFGNGSQGNPLGGNVNISTAQGNAIQSTGSGLFVQNFVQDGIKQPGAITWIQNYDYDVSPAIGVIGGVEYTSVWTPITLATSDPTYDRIDLVVFNAGVGSSVGTISVITGTPSDDPQQPTVADPSTQLAMAFILVTANTTAPPTPPTQDWIYINNAEWTTASSTARINPAGTSFPYSPPLDVDGTFVQNNDNIRFTSVSPPTISNFNVLTFKIRSKSVWAADSKIGLRWYSGATPIGSEVALANGAFGFTSSNFSTYQIVSIPLYSFGSLASVTNLLMTIRTTGGRTIGFWIDDIQLQQGIVPAVGYTASNGLTMVGNDNQLGGALTKNTTITSAGRTLNFNGYVTSGSWMNITANISNALTINADPDALISVGFTGAGVVARNRNTLVSSVETALKIQRTGPTTPTTGYGAAIEYMLTTAGSTTPSRSNRLISAWTDEGLATRTSQFVISGVNSAVESDLFTLSGNGALKLNKYVTGAFTGTPTNTLQTDANGNIIQGAVSISGITADNGLTANTSTNVQLGSTSPTGAPLSADRYVYTSTNTLNFLGVGTVNTVGILNQNGVSGVGLDVTSDFGVGANIGTANGSHALGLSATPTTTDVVQTVLKINRLVAGGTAADGIGNSIDFHNQHSNGQSNLSNQIISTWSTANSATRVSQLIITGVNSAVTSDLLTISGSGATRLNKYGVATFSGTPAYALAVEADGDIIETAVSGSGFVYTASNGLTMTANNVTFGGTLTGATTINTGGFATTWTGANTGTTFTITNTSSGGALYVSSTSNTAISGIGTTGKGGAFQSTDGNGVEATTSSASSAAGSFNLIAATTSTVRSVMDVSRLTSGTAANGIGSSISFNTSTTVGGKLSNELISKWTDATDATRTSQFIITGVNSAVTADLFTLSGSGSLKLNKYGVNTFAGVAAYVIGVDASGNLVEVAAAGAGMTNVLTTTGDIIYSSSGTTPARLGIGTNGQVLTVSGGLPVWSTVVGTGSVTDVTWTGGIVSIATSTTTPAFTIAGTSGGIPYFSSASAWASSAALADNAIVIGGGAGNAPETTTTGTGVLTALGVNVGSAGAFVTFDGALGTPSSGVATNLTGTATALNIGGNAATATILQTTRNINGVAFNGSADITVTAAAGTLTGTTLNATVVTSSLTSVGTIATGVWQGTAIGDTYISSATTWNAKQTGDATLTALAGLTITNGSIIYGTGADAFAVLAAGSNGQVLTLAGGVPSWAAAGSGTVTSVAMSVPSFLSVSGSPITGAGTFAVSLSGTALPAANGGTGLTSYGSANQITGMNAGATALEYKTFSAANGASVTHAANSVVISTVFNPTVQTLTDGSTISWNVTNGGNAVVTLAGTGRILSISNPVAGYTYTIRVIQGSGGSKTITTWPTNTKWPGGVAITLSTTAGDYDVINFFYDGTNYYATYQNDFS